MGTASLPVLMYHGIGTNSAIWSDWLPELAVHHRVIRFDTRGFGCSRSAWNDRPTLEGLVEDAMSVADAAGEQHFHLVGESLGGTAALAAALACPERVASVVASNATHRGTGVVRARTWRSELARDGMSRWADDMMGARFKNDAPLADAQRVWFARTQANSDPTAIVELGELLTGLDLSNDVRGIRQPVLILSPDDSPFISAAMAAELQALIPGARLSVVPHTRHGLPFSHGRHCADLTRRFLAGLPG